MNSIPAFGDCRVLVVGDVMLDRYWYGNTGRVSPEAPVPVVRIGDEEQRPGGAANVALNLASIGVQTRLLGVVGDDASGRAARHLLDQAGVSAALVASASHPTIAKLRVMSRNQQLIRLDFEQAFDMAGAFERSALLAHLDEALTTTDVVICSDYGKGTLCDVTTIIERSRAAGVPVLIDPKGQAWQRYAGASLITPNAAEFETLVGAESGASDDDEWLRQQAEAVRQRLSLQALLVTRSDKGMNLFTAEGAWHLPTRAQEVFDVTGAGDTVIAMVGAGLAAGLDQDRAAAVANLAAGVVVGKLGTATVTPSELHRAARRGAGADKPGIVEEATLLNWVDDIRHRGETLVMTNGCFDLLHPGHIAYLEAARALGDWLIVAVNDDASVARLKSHVDGPPRPINDLNHRMQVLRGLSAVDWVVSFAEDTPARLICRVRPDILVKGGDYRVGDIAGSDCVLASGGQVRMLDFVEGFSTTDMVTRLATGSKLRGHDLSSLEPRR